VGVAVFFALSAFLLGGPWLGAGDEAEGPVEGQPQTVRAYAARRAARILPAYLVVLAVVAVAAVAWDPEGSPLGRLLGHLVLLEGFTGDQYQGFSQVWSLTTEVTFYAALPLLHRLGVRVRSLRGPVVVATVGLAVQWLVPVLGLPGVTGWVLANSILGHAAWFAAGLVALRVATHPGPRTLVWAESPATCLAVAGTLLAVAATGVAGPAGLTPGHPVTAVVKEGLYAVIAGLVVLAGARATGPVARALGHEMATSLGRWSYGIFLWHVLVLQAVFALAGLTLFSGPLVLVLVLVTVTTVGLAALTWQVLERPVLGRVHAATREPGRVTHS
jgi:peptidoglycan/LPS O-acetylase OafA/YrhL